MEAKFENVGGKIVSFALILLGLSLAENPWVKFALTREIPGDALE